MVSPLLPLDVANVVKKTHGGHCAPFLLQLMLQKKEGGGGTHPPFPFDVVNVI